MFSPLKVATQGRHSRAPLKVATQGGHNMCKRSLDIQVVVLYVKNGHHLKNKSWDPLRDLRGKYGMCSPLKVAMQDRHARSPLHVATICENYH